MLKQIIFLVFLCSFSFVSCQLDVGNVACVYGTLGYGVNVHSGPCTSDPVLFISLEGDSYSVTSGPTSACGYTWYQMNNNGWIVDEYLQYCGGPKWNVFGVGLVSEGNQQQWDYVGDLAGQEGWMLLIFPGINNQTTTAQSSWIDGLNAAYEKNLNPVLRLSPPWGDSYYRDESNDPEHRNYTTLANAFKSVVASLPLKEGQNVYLQIDNEPDLCGEWFCEYPGPPISYTEIAAEYASFYQYVVNAIRSLEEPRWRVSTAALAPGGNIQCGCCGEQSCSGDQGGITGLQFMQAMQQAIPNIFDYIDYLASHSYPASGIGYGFNVPYDQAMPGLTYYQAELQQINRTVQVIITETGWATSVPGDPACSQDDKAQWTTQAYTDPWLSDDRIMGVTPFVLQDQYWGDQMGYGYVDVNNNIEPVYSQVQGQRSSIGF